MTNALIGKLPIFAYGGMVLFILIVVQVLIAKHVIKVDFKWHRWLGWTILILAGFHGILAMLYLLR